MSFDQSILPKESFECHAKHIKNQFSIPFCHAETIVAKMHDCFDWAELVNKISDKESAIELTRKSFLASKFLLSKFEFYLDPYVEEIKSFIEEKEYISVLGSNLEKISNRNFSYFSSDEMCFILDAVFEDLSKDRIENIQKIVSCLVFLDNTLTNSLKRKGNLVSQIDISSSHYGHRFYGHCVLDNKKLHINCTEWDLLIESPRFKPLKERDIYNVCSEKWFLDYMIGFINILIIQYKSIGYSGVISIYKVMNTNVIGWQKKLLKGSSDFKKFLEHESEESKGSLSWDKEEMEYEKINSDKIISLFEEILTVFKSEVKDHYRNGKVVDVSIDIMI